MVPSRLDVFLFFHVIIFIVNEHTALNASSVACGPAAELEFNDDLRDQFSLIDRETRSGTDDDHYRKRFWGRPEENVTS